MKIAILDDDQSIRTTLCLLLKTLGHSPKAFSTEKELLLGIESFGPGMLLLDQMLGGKRTGIQLAPDLRNDNPDLTIVIISGYPRAELKEAVELNEVGFLSKPFSLAELEETVSACLAQ